VVPAGTEGAEPELARHVRVEAQEGEAEGSSSMLRSMISDVVPGPPVSRRAFTIGGKKRVNSGPKAIVIKFLQERAIASQRQGTMLCPLR